MAGLYNEMAKMSDSGNSSGANLQDALAERALIKRARKGDQVAAKRLVEAHQQRLFAFVWRIVRNWHEAEEICQEAFFRAFAHLHEFDETYRFSTWLFTIAYRLSLNRVRKAVPVAADLDANRLPSDQQGVPESVAQTEEAARLKSLVWEAVDQLSEPQKAAVMLYYREGMSCQQISEVMGIPVATVKSHLHRARARLKHLLAPVRQVDWQSLRLA